MGLAGTQLDDTGDHMRLIALAYLAPTAALAFYLTSILGVI